MARATHSATKCVAVQSRSRIDHPSSTAICRASKRNRSGRTPRGCQRGSGRRKYGSASQCSISSWIRWPCTANRPPGSNGSSPVGQPLGQQVQQPRPGPTSNERTRGSPCPSAAAGQVAEPGGASQVEQHAVPRGALSRTHSARAVSGPPWPPGGQVAGGKGVDHVQAGRLGQSGRVAQAEIAARLALPAAPQPGIVDADGQHAAGRHPGLGQQGIDHRGLEARPAGSAGPRASRRVDRG